MTSETGWFSPLGDPNKQDDRAMLLLSEEEEGYPPAKRARGLIAWVREDTAALSSPTQIAAHVAYQELIEMGMAALPVLLAELRDRGGAGWYIALHAILKAAGIPGPDFSGGHPGTTAAVNRAWLAWGSLAGVLYAGEEEAVLPAVSPPWEPWEIYAQEIYAQQLRQQWE